MKIEYDEKQKDIEPINTFIVPFCWTHLIEDCVARIWRFNDPLIHRLILIDNTCEEGGFIKRLRDQCHLYIKAYRNLGGNMGWNIGVSIATTKYVTLLGDDTKLLHKSWWERMYERLKNGARIVYSKNARKVLTTEPKAEYTNEEIAKFKMSHGRGYVLHAITMEKSLFKELDGFPDKKYPLVFADTALSARINVSKKKENIGYLCPGAYVWHKIGGSIQDELKPKWKKHKTALIGETDKRHL